MPSTWTCRSCRAVNARTASKRCQTCGRSTKPARRVPRHAVTLRDDSHAHYVQVNAAAHAAAFGGEWQPEWCGVCGKPPKARRHDRDHDHLTGLPRGLACGGNQGCNALMPGWLTLERARAIVGYLERVEAFYGDREAVA